MGVEKKRRRGQRGEVARKKAKHWNEPCSNEADESTDFVVNGDAGADYISFGQESNGHETDWQEDTPFYGLLDPQEQDYYASVNAKLLGVNEFSSDEDRALFIDAVYRESEGKELKIASSQSCSRYLERLIQISSPTQVRTLFAKFAGHFLHLVQHRFASHCCEALFLRAAKEVGGDDGEGDEAGGRSDGQGKQVPSMEALFLLVVDELQQTLGYLLTEQFASHVVRVLFLILSGEPLSDSASSTLASRKKEKIETVEPLDEPGSSAESRHVPTAFKGALQRMLSSSVSSLDTTYIRALATHPTGNPTLQILLRVELVQGGKSRAKDASSIMRRLLPDESLGEDTESAKFVQGLLYDPTGSRLLETIIQHAPGKMFKKLYGNLLKPRVCSMVKNETATYVAARILERLSAVDLKASRDEILPEIPTLVARNRMGIIRILLERCSHRGVDVQPISSALQSEYGGDVSVFLLHMMHMDTEEKKEAKGNDCTPSRESETKRDQPSKEKNHLRIANIHGVLLACSMARIPATCPLIQQSLQSLPTPTLLCIAKDPSASRLLQQTLLPTTTTTTTTTDDPQKQSTTPTPTTTITHTKLLIPKLLDHIADLAIHPSGSHVVDALWAATTTTTITTDVTITTTTTSSSNLYFLKERIAAHLSQHEPLLRSSPHGRHVWRNWAMDLYSRRPREWKHLARTSNNITAGTRHGGEEQEGEMSMEPWKGVERRGGNVVKGKDMMTKVQKMANGTRIDPGGRLGKGSINRRVGNESTCGGTDGGTGGGDGGVGKGKGKTKTALDLARLRFATSSAAAAAAATR